MSTLASLWVAEQAPGTGQSQSMRNDDTMPTIVHFEIPADDLERATKFYNNLFGWNIEKLRSSKDDSQPTSVATGQPIEYWRITTTNEKGNKDVGGGIMKRQMPEHHITNYIGVDSVNEYSSSCLLYTSPSPRDRQKSRMPSSA